MPVAYSGAALKLDGGTSSILTRTFFSFKHEDTIFPFTVLVHCYTFHFTQSPDAFNLYYATINISTIL